MGDLPLVLQEGERCLQNGYLPHTSDRFLRALYGLQDYVAERESCERQLLELANTMLVSANQRSHKTARLWLLNASCTYRSLRLQSEEWIMRNLGYTYKHEEMLDSSQVLADPSSLVEQRPMEATALPSLLELKVPSPGMSSFQFETPMEPRSCVPEKARKAPRAKQPPASGGGGEAAGGMSDPPSVKQKCWMHGCRGDGLSLKHVMKHVPNIFSYTMGSSLRVQSKRLAALLSASRRLKCTADKGLEGLMARINQAGLLQPADNHLSPEERQIIHDYATTLMLPEDYQVCPLTSSAALVHWRVLMVVAVLLKPQGARLWKEACDKGTDSLQQGESIPCSRPEVFDAFFQVDKALTVAGIKAPDASLQDLLDHGRQKYVYQASEKLIGGCASFSTPASYPTEAVLRRLRLSVVVAVGMYPNHVLTDQQANEESLNRLRELLGHPRVTAMGAVGLDLRRGYGKCDQQRELALKILGWLEPRHVLILVCQAFGTTAESIAAANHILLDLMFQAHVPKEQRILLHGFRGDRYIVDAWIEGFPNTHFSFTRLNKKREEFQREAIQHMDQFRLLLETSSPYFKQPDTRLSYPGELAEVAEEVAEIRGESVAEIFKVTTSNAFRFFQVDCSSQP